MSVKIFFIVLILFFIMHKKYKTNIEGFHTKRKREKDWLEDIFEYRQIITIPSRKTHVKEFCKSFEINQTIFNAILKKNISYKNLYGLKIGEIACALSQEAVLRKFIKTEKESMIMFEDDNMTFSMDPTKNSNLSLCDIKKYIKNAYDMLPMDWDVLYLGRCWDNCSKHIKINKYLYKTHRTLCHHAIAFSRQGAIRVVEAIDHPMQRPIDHVVANLSMQGEIDSYATVIPIFYQNRDVMKSTVGNFDNLPICA